MQMEVMESDGTATLVRLTGRLDSRGVDGIDLRFTAGVVSPGRNTLVDLSGVSFVASMGIRLLISSARSLSKKGGTLVLFGAQELVQSVLEHAAIDQIIPVVATQQEALERLHA